MSVLFLMLTGIAYGGVLINDETNAAPDPNGRVAVARAVLFSGWAAFVMLGAAVQLLRVLRAGRT